MKHLLILLSFLLLSSPLFSQSKETGVLFQYKTSSGFVWKTFGKGEFQPKYKGEISNGTPEGLGVYRIHLLMVKELKVNGKMVRSGTPNITKKMGKSLGNG